MNANVILFTALALWSFWALYVFGMGIYRAWLMRRLRGLNALLAAPIVGVALLIDAVMQFTVLAFAFLELPPITWRKAWRWTVPIPEMLVTYRLRRYMRSDLGWRTRWADQVCRYLLDPFDPTGAHCDEEPAVRA